jgi:hypothetical protein
MSSSDFDEAWNRFYREYGQAMVAWQSVESELATVFSTLTKIPPAMAIQIFYSARSFTGRIDIYKAGVTACTAPDDIKTFARELINKARGYTEYRNKFAHDQPRIRQHEGEVDIVMVDGKGQFQIDEMKSEYLARAVTVAEITEAATCFQNLADLIRDFWAQLVTRSSSLNTLRARLEALPILPRKAALFQPSAAPKSPPDPSQL